MANDEVVIKQYLIKYQHPDYTAKEVVNLIQRYKSLTCRLEVFVFNNGARKDLLNLEGTLPVSYKGAVYNIPVSIWLMDTHPENAPLCFVKPTADMSIKVSKYVDSNGKVFLPYLHSWNAKSSNLLGLIVFMINAFGEIPPVFTKRKLPYPVATQGPSFPYLQQNVPQPFVAPGPPYPANTGMPYPNFGSPYPGYPNPGVNNGVSPFMPTNPPHPNTSYGPGTQGISIPGGTITEEHIAASLLSAVQDKLRRRLNEQAQQSSAELETLRRTQQELQTGQTRLDDILAKLQRERTDLDKNVLILQEKEKELEAAVERLSEQESVDVDEAVVTTAPIYSQLLNAFAKEATLEDAIYYMGEALRKEVIDLDTFLKQVRTLARGQFTLRALMHKCRQKAQLAC